MKKLLVVLVLSALPLAFTVPTLAAEPLSYAAYLDWNGSKLSSNSSISQSITPLALPPHMYWETGWHWDNAPDGGYGGIQTLGYLADGRLSDLAIFSIWNAKEGVPGKGAGCLPFGGEGVGFSCRLPLEMKAGDKFTFEYSLDTKRGPEWWMAKVAKNSEEAILIGSIRASHSGLESGNLNNFVEYWGSAKIACNLVPSASAIFGTPTSSDKNIKITLDRFSKPLNPCGESSYQAILQAEEPSFTLNFGNPAIKEYTNPIPVKSTKKLIGKYRNCSQLNRVYSGGISKSLNPKNKGKTLTRAPFPSSQGYLRNISLDFDRDGIACEK